MSKLQEVGHGDGAYVYLDEEGGLVIHPGKTRGPRMKKELHLAREDAINLAMAILAWEKPEEVEA